MYYITASITRAIDRKIVIRSKGPNALENEFTAPLAPMGESVGAVVGTFAGESVGFCEGLIDGLLLGDLDGFIEGEVVGVLVGNILGDVFGAAVGVQLLRQIYPDAKSSHRLSTQSSSVPRLINDLQTS